MDAIHSFVPKGSTVSAYLSACMDSRWVSSLVAGESYSLAAQAVTSESTFSVVTPMKLLKGNVVDVFIFKIVATSDSSTIDLGSFSSLDSAVANIPPTEAMRNACRA